MKDIKKLYNKLVREIIKREKYYLSKSEEWQQSVRGDKYGYITDMLTDIQESIITSRGYQELILPRK